MYAEVRKTVWTAAWFPRQRLLVVCFWSWLKRMSTWGIMQWNTFRKKLKVSLSSSLTNPPASRSVVGPNSPDGFRTLADVTFAIKQCSQHRYGSSILLCLLLGVCVPPLYQAINSLGRSWKKTPENPARSEKNWLTNGKLSDLDRKVDSDAI